MDLFEVIEKRRSIRSYKPNPIPNEHLKKILEAARLAPSGKNRQPWRFVVVRDAERKERLAEAAMNQMFIAEADVVVVALSDPTVYSSIGGKRRIPYLQDPMIAIEHMVLAATSLGYGTCWIGAFNEGEVKRIINAPEKLAVIALLPIGVPNESPSPRLRKPFEEIFFSEVYGKPLII
ncbi:nitroreductase [Candidatus Bathyarchaeota archaeon]|nr:MAG: nitroreductase [Candidatus Bathyarchaeota archaeon]